MILFIGYWRDLCLCAAANPFLRQMQKSQGSGGGKRACFCSRCPVTAGQDLRVVATRLGEVRACTSSSDQGCPIFSITYLRPWHTAGFRAQQPRARLAGGLVCSWFHPFHPRCFFLAAGAELMLPFTFSLNFFSYFVTDLSLLTNAGLFSASCQCFSRQTNPLPPEQCPGCTAGSSWGCTFGQRIFTGREPLPPCPAPPANCWFELKGDRVLSCACQRQYLLPRGSFSNT